MADIQSEKGERKDDDDRNMDDYRSRCSCPPCPTYAECARQKGELVFCLTKKSGCISEMKVCFCPGCSVHEELDLEFMYYCLRGNEGEQRGR